MKEIIKTELIKLKLFLLRSYWAIKRSIIVPKLPTNADGKVYLNLGSGAKTSSEFINIDAIKLPHMHYIGDICDLYMIASQSVDLIYLSHVIEHIPRNDLQRVLREWRRVLKLGGVLRFAVPDFDRLLEVYYASGKNVDSIMPQLMGGAGGYDDHHSIWNFEFANMVLAEAGFGDLKIWDPEKVDHHDFRDKSSRMMNAGEKKILISLNIEAVKK